MNHADHVELLRPAVAAGQTWADIGAGTGAFTLALAELLGPGGRIVAVDRDADALAEAVSAVASRFPQVRVEAIRADFTHALTGLPPLDGLVAANSLHFVARDRQADVIRGLASLVPGGIFVVVEYDADRGNPWVPHPFRFATWEGLAGEAGLVEVRQLGRVPSRFLGAIYAAPASVPAEGLLRP